MVYGITLNELKEKEIQKNIKEKKEYKLVKESDTKLVFRRELNQYSPDYFELKIVDSKVIIYNIVS
ncbi:hypothetical protein D3C81_1952560 [compost metagenome]